MISVAIFVTTLFVYVLSMLKKVFLFEMTMLILGVLGSRLSLNVINIVVIVDS